MRAAEREAVFFEGVIQGRSTSLPRKDTIQEQDQLDSVGLKRYLRTKVREAGNRVGTEGWSWYGAGGLK